jgi:hypothetical protein
LTPAITKADLSQRLGTFGAVEALDGFEKVDGVCQARRFAYVTFNNWRDEKKHFSVVRLAKLRIGEAKPDFFETGECSKSYPQLLSSTDAFIRTQNSLRKGSSPL